MSLPPRGFKPSRGVNGMYGGRAEYYQGRPHHGYANGRYPYDFGLLAGKGFLPDYPSTFTGKTIGQKTVDYEYEDEEDIYNKEGIEDEHEGKKLVEHDRINCDKTCEDDEILCYKGCMCIKEEER